MLGRYLPTAKNGQVARWYPDRGFEPVGEGLFRLDLEQQRPTASYPMKVKVLANA